MLWPLIRTISMMGHKLSFYGEIGLIILNYPCYPFFSHPLDKNIPFYRCLRFFYPGLLSCLSLGSESCLNLGSESCLNLPIIA